MVGAMLATYLGSSLLGGSLLLGCSLLLRNSLLRSSLLGRLLLELGRELVGVLGLDKVTSSNTVLQGREESSVQPLLVLWQVVLHVLLDGNRRRTIAVLQRDDGGDNSFLVRHDDSSVDLVVIGAVQKEKPGSKKQMLRANDGVVEASTHLDRIR